MFGIPRCVFAPLREKLYFQLQPRWAMLTIAAAR
jgi:hypothetical protein